MVLIHPTEDGHGNGDPDTSKLSDLQNRLIEANLRRRHNILLAQKRLAAAKTQLTGIPSDSEYPSGRKMLQCPCCCQSLPVETFQNPNMWK